ncbi:AAA-like domain-containing protein [Clostridium felsineum]|uniref:AAA-like domain-containing protein n=1 Tax=Clostridium felsineum TaxID=36839 RepID=UPI00214D8156|nr:AAA-like domain-containing protein [Clostridium felsineum]MCR3761295.1 AAA-like domain-containing protein [Clostridium felsineum]
MNKHFNTTGLCVPKKHFMVNITNKINEISKLILRENYFVINRPRQYGKTTILNQVKNHLKNQYVIISISFEGIGDLIFTDEKLFCTNVLDIMADALETSDEVKCEMLREFSKKVSTLKDLSKAITKFVNFSDKEVILLIDEVDKSSNNQLFLSFLGMLRNKYLLRDAEEDYTFKSVILAGVHDIKTLKLKIRDEQNEKYNSPWNIAINFNIDLSFNSSEIETMLIDYNLYNKLSMDCQQLSERIYYFTNGYPFLVSRLCQIIDEDFYQNKKLNWKLNDIDMAVKHIVSEVNTLFESLVKNLENNSALYELVNRILIKGENIPFNALNPLINLGITYGFFKEENGNVFISNKIFEEIIYNYMLSKMITKTRNLDNYNFKYNFIESNGGLNFPKILRRFQQFIKEQYSIKDLTFIENNGRLLFLAFVKPIINGIGFDFKEVQISEEKRLDLVITYNTFKYIVELKIWRGKEYHEKGIRQLCDYLNINGLDYGFLVIFNFNKNKEYKEETIEIDEKKILAVYV